MFRSSGESGNPGQHAPEFAIWVPAFAGTSGDDVDSVQQEHALMPSKRTRVSPIAWAIAPAALLFVLFFILPFGVMAALSFLSGNPVSNPNVTFTWRHYIRLFDSDLYFDALVATMRIGAITTVIALL